MDIAESKKQSNISEYIIHMYQTEDLIRIYGFDMEKIKEYVIKHIPGDEAKKEDIANWYSEISDDMKKEGLEDRGHLKSIQHYVKTLSALKSELLEKDDDFKKIYKKAEPHIKESLEMAHGLVKDEVQACLNGIYGLLLLRINGKKVHPEILESANTFGDVLSYLSYKYKQTNYMSDN